MIYKSKYAVVPLRSRHICFLSFGFVNIQGIILTNRRYNDIIIRWIDHKQQIGEIKVQPKEFITFMNVIEKLKCNTRHSWTSSGRHESVAEHSWRLAVMALLCSDEYPELDMDKVIKMCLIHDLGEAITGDIPSFNKTEENERTEDKAIEQLMSLLPEHYSEELSRLFDEMRERQTSEAKLFKALDNMEAVISHNEADISSWIPFEYSENLVYGQDAAAWSDWTRRLRAQLKEDSLSKIERAQKQNGQKE